MEKGLLIAILTGLGGMFGWGLADIFVKRVINRIGDLAPLFWSHFVGIFPLLIIFLFYPSIPRLTELQWVFLVFLGILDGLTYIPLYIAFRKGMVSLLSPIFATYPVLVAIVSAIFFGEIIPYERQLIFILIFVGIILINGDPRNLFLLIIGKSGKEMSIQGLPEIILAACVTALYIIALNYFISSINWIPVILIIRILSTLTLFFYAQLIKRSVIFHEIKLWKFIILIGLFEVIAFSSVSFGLSATPYVSIVAMLSSAFALPVIVLGYLFLKERPTRLQTIGSLITIGGIMLLSI